MSQSRFEELKEIVRSNQNTFRYEHTLGVMYTAGALAMRYQVDLEKAMTAGLLHDCAKGYSNEVLLTMCESYNLSISKSERANPSLLHAKLGAYMAKRAYDIVDEEIISAINWHTTGKPEMSLLDKIIYIADYIEPNRKQAPNLERLRYLAFIDIDECLYQILKQSLSYLQTQNEVIDPMTEQTYLYYKNLRGE